MTIKTLEAATIQPDIQYEFVVGINTVSEANARGHWHKGAKRHADQKKTVWFELHRRDLEIRLPCAIQLTRIAPRKLDKGDNLPMSMKYIRDSIAEFVFPDMAVGRADDLPALEFIYSQEKGDPKQYGVKITIYDRKKCCCACHRQSEQQGVMLC